MSGPLSLAPMPGHRVPYPGPDTRTLRVLLRDDNGGPSLADTYRPAPIVFASAPASYLLAYTRYRWSLTCGDSYTSS